VPLPTSAAAGKVPFLVVTLGINLGLDLDVVEARGEIRGGEDEGIGSHGVLNESNYFRLNTIRIQHDLQVPGAVRNDAQTTSDSSFELGGERLSALAVNHITRRGGIAINQCPHLHAGSRSRRVSHHVFAADCCGGIKANFECGVDQEVVIIRHFDVLFEHGLPVRRYVGRCASAGAERTQYIDV